MKQQINLYQPIFRRQKKVFSALAMLQVCAFMLMVFTTIYFYGQFKLQPLQDQLVRLNQDMALLNSQLSKLESRQQVDSKNRLLENEIARLSVELTKRRQVQSILSTRELGNTKGLSGYLEAFARQHVQGIWLTRINIANGGRNLGFHGKTRSSELVPVYIARLSGEELLNGMSFNVMELVKPAEPSNHLDFYVSTK